MNATWFDQGMLLGQQKGREEGKQLGQRASIITMLEERFGAVNDEVRAKLDAWSSERLEELIGGILKGKSLQELGLES